MQRVKNMGSVFLFTAVVLFFAHKFIPHHHHNQQVCIEKSHCENQHSLNEQDAGCSHNKHNEESRSECCLLNQLVIVPGNHWKQDDIESFSCDIPACGFALLNCTACSPADYLAGQACEFAHGSPPPSAFFTLSPTALRAPPTV